MKIIDNSKEEFKDLPDSVNGHIFSHRTYDNKGNYTGVVSIHPEHLKWMALNQTPDELNRGGWGNGTKKEILDAVRERADINAKKPEGIS